ncbi:MAG: hypothetical protein ACI9AF_001457, partial [Granulosicoccus sp.]
RIPYKSRPARSPPKSQKRRGAGKTPLLPMS